MKIHLISDNADACVGLRLAGIEYTLVTKKEETIAAFEKAVNDKDVGIILVTMGLYERRAGIVDDYKRRYSVPLISEIPDSGGDFKSDAITRYVSQAVGIG